MRILSDLLRASLETTSAILDHGGNLPPAPDALGGKSLTELLKDGTVYFKIDPKFPQALGITSIISWVSVFGNSRWENLRNEEPDTPFLRATFPWAWREAPTLECLTELFLWRPISRFAYARTFACQAKSQTFPSGDLVQSNAHCCAKKLLKSTNA